MRLALINGLLDDLSCDAYVEKVETPFFGNELYTDIDTNESFNCCMPGSCLINTSSFLNIKHKISIYIPHIPSQSNETCKEILNLCYHKIISTAVNYGIKSLVIPLLNVGSLDNTSLIDIAIGSLSTSTEDLNICILITDSSAWDFAKNNYNQFCTDNNLYDAFSKILLMSSSVDTSTQNSLINSVLSKISEHKELKNKMVPFKENFKNFFLDLPEKEQDVLSYEIIKPFYDDYQNKLDNINKVKSILEKFQEYFPSEEE